MVQSQPFATPAAASNRIVSNGSTIDLSAHNSQHPTPQGHQNHMEAVLGGKGQTQLDSSPLGGGAGLAGPTVLSATAFPTSGLHGGEVRDAPLQAMSSSISVGGGGGSRFAQ